MEKFPVEKEIGDALLNWASPINNMLDAMRYLAAITTNKENYLRFICYLIGLKIIPDQRPQWIPGIMEIGRLYNDHCRRFVDDCYEDPCAAVVEPKSSDIENSVEENWEWFMAVCFNQMIPPEAVGDARIRVKRMFVILSRSSNFSFSCNYVRIAYMMYCLCLSFSVIGGLPNFFAEAVACSLSRAMISLISGSRQMDRLKMTDEHFTTLNDLGKKYTGKIVRKAEICHVDWLEMTVLWESTMFTYVHCPANLLLLWDHIIFHVEEYYFFMRFLYVAHFAVMEAENIDISNQRQIDDMMWNGVELLHRVEDLMKMDLRKTIDWWSLCPCYAMCQRCFRPNHEAMKKKARRIFK